MSLLVATRPIRKPLPPEWFVDHGHNAEMRWEAMRDQDYLVPTERFFVRNHTSTPLIDAARWRLHIHGPGIRCPLSLSYADLERLPSRSLTSVIECAGSGGRDFFVSQQGTPVEGTPWKLGGIGAAQWRGVPLGEVLDRPGLEPDAVDVMGHGLDDPYLDSGCVRRPLPVGKAIDDVLIALEMKRRRAGSRPRLPRAARRARLGRRREHQVARRARGVHRAAVLALEHALVRRLDGAAGQERVRARLGRHAPGGRSAPAHGPLVVGQRADSRRRGEHQRWRDLAPRAPARTQRAARLGPLGAAVDAGARPRRAARARDRPAGLTQPDAVPFNAGGYQFWAVVRHPVTAR